MMKLAVLAAGALAAVVAAPAGARIPQHFESVGPDRRAIETLLATYTKAVSTKDRALFESLLLNTAIPFSHADPDMRTAAPGGTANYANFRKGVFEGSPFTQRFRDVRIEQDGDLASVTLVFVNTAPDGDSWGWKALQLLKSDGAWKIASEFYTTHRGTR